MFLLSPLEATMFRGRCESEVAQSCPTLCDHMDCSLPGSSVHGIFLTIVLEWIAISFSRGSSRRRDRTQVSCIAVRGFNLWSTRDLIRCLQIGCTGDHLSSMEFWELTKKMVVEHDQWHWEQTMPFSKFHIKHAYDATIHITCFSEGFEVSLNMAIAIIMKW